jgi:glycoside/pentoside/hexuronide:cation symporter, GPH family
LAPDLAGAATSSTRRTNSQIVAYAAIVCPLAIMHGPAFSVLPALYAKHAGISLTVIGSILIVARIFDAVTDPLVGYLSDRTRSPWGRRKPWILAGALICSIAVYFMFRPGPNTGAMYFMFWSFALYTGWTLVEIPHTAWLSELTDDYDERTKISSYRSAAAFIGGILFKASALLPLFATTEMTPEVTAFVSWIIIFSLIPLTIVALRYVDQGERPAQTRPAFRGTIAGILQNEPFRRFGLLVLVTSIASGMVAGLYFFFLDAYLGIVDKFAHVGLIVAAIGLASTFAWPPLIRRFEKHIAVALCGGAVVATLIAMAFIEPGPFAFPALAVIFGLSAFFAAGTIIAQTAMLADIVDYDRWRTDANRAGNYYAFLAFAGKFGIAIGGGAGIAIAGLFGFSASGGNNSTAMVGFYVSFIWIPIALNLIGVFLALRFPLDRNTQAKIATELRVRGLQQHGSE